MVGDTTMEGITVVDITTIVVTDIVADIIIMADTDTIMDVDIKHKLVAMVTTTIKVNIKSVVNIKHKIENMISKISTTKTIIKNTTRVTSMIIREVITINKQGQEIQVRLKQETHVKQEQVRQIIGQLEVARGYFYLS